MRKSKNIYNASVNIIYSTNEARVIRVYPDAYKMKYKPGQYGSLGLESQNNPNKILKTTSRDLKSAGLSRQKVFYLKNIAKAFKNKSFDTKKLKKMKDDEAIQYITKLKGLGVWSAEMFLMFNLNRPNIFPIKDIGLLRSISKNYKTSYPPSKRFLNKISNLHSGYRSVSTWFLWRDIDSEDVEY